MTNKERARQTDRNIENQSNSKKRTEDRHNNIVHTVCPRSSAPFYIVTYYIKWGTTSWTYSTSINVICIVCNGET